MTNTELEEWYVNRPDQAVLQTFHGYPSKAMGDSSGAPRQLPPRRVRTMRGPERGHLGPDPHPDPGDDAHYREQYGYTGPAHEQATRATTR